MKTLLFSGSNSETSINEMVIKNIYNFHKEDCDYFDIKNKWTSNQKMTPTRV